LYSLTQYVTRLRRALTGENTINEWNNFILNPASPTDGHDTEVGNPDQNKFNDFND